MLLASIGVPRRWAKTGERKMEPKLYLLFALFSSIVVSASHETLRDYIKKYPWRASVKRIESDA